MKRQLKSYKGFEVTKFTDPQIFYIASLGRTEFRSNSLDELKNRVNDWCKLYR